MSPTVMPAENNFVIQQMQENCSNEGAAGGEGPPILNFPFTVRNQYRLPMF